MVSLGMLGQNGRGGVRKEGQAGESKEHVESPRAELDACLRLEQQDIMDEDVEIEFDLIFISLSLVCYHPSLCKA